MKIIFVFVITLAIANCKLPKRIRMNHLDVRAPNSQPYVPIKNSNRIVGGTAVKPIDLHLYKFLVRLIMQDKDNENRYSDCGGSLISSTWVLTAAHCLDSCRSVEMFFGLYDENDTEGIMSRKAYAPNDIIYHTKFNHATLTNDIGLIRLTPELELNDQVQPIRLPRRDEPCENYFGRHVTISGWGNQNDYWENDSRLQTVDVDIVNNKEECQKTWGNYVKFDTMICVSAAGDRGACQGDSGGPMVYTQSNGLQLLIGLTSFGTARGCQTSDPRVFTCCNGISHRDFIYEHTRDDYLNM